MTRSRAEIVSKLIGCCRERFASLRDGRYNDRVCPLLDECNHLRDDMERAQCDTWHLGCLVRCFPAVGDPRFGEKYTGTASHVLENITNAEKFQETGGHIFSDDFVSSHVQGTSCGQLSSLIRKHMDRVKGLTL